MEATSKGRFTQYSFRTRKNTMEAQHFIKSKKITTNLTNPYFISATFRTCFFDPFSNFNDEEIKVCMYVTFIYSRCLQIYIFQNK